MTHSRLESWISDELWEGMQNNWLRLEQWAGLRLVWVDEGAGRWEVDVCPHFPRMTSRRLLEHYGLSLREKRCAKGLPITLVLFPMTPSGVVNLLFAISHHVLPCLLWRYLSTVASSMSSTRDSNERPDGCGDGSRLGASDSEDDDGSSHRPIATKAA